MAKKTLYDVLQVSRNADPETIKAAYKSLVQRYHPDRNPDNPEAEKFLKEINRAYELLSDPVKRAGYDAALMEEDEVQSVSRQVWNGFPSEAKPSENYATLQSASPAKEHGYRWILDFFPAAATAQLFRSLVLASFSGTPETSGWVVFFSMLFGGGIGYVLSYYLRTLLTTNMQSRSTELFSSVFISIGLTLSILTTTMLLTKPVNDSVSPPPLHEISYKESTGQTKTLSSMNAGWVRVGSTVVNSYENAGRIIILTIYADPATIQKAGNIVKMWWLTDLNMVDTINGKPYLSIKSQKEYDCKEAQFRLLYLSNYSENMGNGKAVEINFNPNPLNNWTPVEHSGISESMWRVACGN